METADVLLLVGLWAELDQYGSANRVSDEKAQAWHAAIIAGAPEMTFEQARDLIVRFYVENPEESLTVARLIKAWRTVMRREPRQIRADVRAARAMGLVPASHPERVPVPLDVAQKLRDYRRGTNAEAEQLTAGDNPGDNLKQITAITDAATAALKTDWK